jgi:hypothetical protein
MEVKTGMKRPHIDNNQHIQQKMVPFIQVWSIGFQVMTLIWIHAPLGLWIIAVPIWFFNFLTYLVLVAPHWCETCEWERQHGGGNEPKV